MGAGVESGSTTLHWAMAELMRHPAIMSKAQAEIRGVFLGKTR
jgi:cytochrome P450